MESLELEIAGFLIRINLFSSKESNSIEKYYKAKILRNFGGFITYGLKKKPNATLDLLFKQNFQFLMKGNTKYFFINFFKKKGGHKYEAYYHLSIDQLKIVLRNILQELLILNKGMIIHASASLMDNKAIIFLGNSGAGKSTITKLLNPEFSFLADDNIILKKEVDKYYCYQTPFIEKNVLIEKRPTKYPIRGFFFLYKGKECAVKLIEKKQIAAKLISKQLLSEQEVLNRQIKNLLDLVATYDSFFKLEFNLTQETKLKKTLINI